MGQGVDAAVSPGADGLEAESDLQSQVKSLQKQIESMDASTLTEAVQKLNTDIQRITSRMRASLVSAEAAVAGFLPASPSLVNGAIASSSPSAGLARPVKLSANDEDSNPYSRLMALQTMGVVKDYQKIRSCTVAIVGIGGVGSVAAEMLTRCGAAAVLQRTLFCRGVGCLLLYDYDSVKQCNLNRMFYRPQQVGMAKADAAAASLKEINPDVEIITFKMNITTVEGFQEFRSSLMHSETETLRIDMLLSCVDNYEARFHINRVCLDLQQDWMESGVSEDAMSGMVFTPNGCSHCHTYVRHLVLSIIQTVRSGHVQLISPGKTACFECAPPLAMASGLDESTLQRQDVCSASLPTTMSIISGLLVQNALKILLGFGEVTQCIGYMSMSDFFPRERLRPDPECTQPKCVQLQDVMRKSQRQTKEDTKQTLAATQEPSTVQHENNDWDIGVIARASQSERNTAAIPFGDPHVAVPDRTVEDLMAELKEFQKD